MTSSYSISAGAGADDAVAPRAIAGTPSAVRAERVEAEHAQAAATAGRKRTLLYVGAAAVAVAVAAIVVVPLARRNAAAGAARDEGTTIARVVEPMVRPAEATSRSAATSRRIARSTRRRRATCA